MIVFLDQACGRPAAFQPWVASGVPGEGFPSGVTDKLESVGARI